MDVFNLRLYLRLADTLHFGKASQASHVSPSTLSRAIQRLEEECGQALFKRDRRSVELTSAGESFRQFATETLRRWGELQKSLSQEGAALKGELSIFCSVTASYSLLPDLLETFRDRHPQIKAQIRTGDVNTAVDQALSGEVDVSIAPLPDRLPPKINALPIALTPLQLIVPAQAGSVREQALARKPDWGKIPVILPESGLIRKRMLAWFRAKGIRPNVYGEAAGHEAIMALVSLGLGFGVIPKLVLEGSLIRSKVEPLDIRPAFEDLEVGVVCAKDRLDDPIINAFWQIVAER